MGWDTAAQPAVLALRDAESSREYIFPAGEDVGRMLLPHVRQLLHDAGLMPSDVELWVVGIGPGSFTGLRIGIIAAQMMAWATNRPVVGISSLSIRTESELHNGRTDAALLVSLGLDKYLATRENELRTLRPAYISRCVN